MGIAATVIAASSSLGALLASPCSSTSLPAVLSPPAASISPVALPATPPTPAASSQVASTRAASPSVESSNSDTGDDREDSEEDDNPDPYAAINVIRASLTITERPPLLSPPEHHSSSCWWNRFNTEAPVDSEAVVAVQKLIDRQRYPHTSRISSSGTAAHAS
ncbi:hypothetical protein F443_19510 [Phytophthora nicotianae P1569]|uniref:RxLR effector protein n=1 Tax=Phytophthora nicotianae P1569 TaxID=1317065 RepID=V9E6J0_PHYNI|nr:hypothetical protein F443_19510 [Phytophthora nicotianae P1569]